MLASSPLENNNKPVFWIAYSGGLDSHVLLHLLTRQAPAGLYKAIHINHGLNPHAEAWEEHCRKISETLGIEYRCIRVDAHPKPGESPEAAARNARYAAFTTLLNRGDSIMTAHHQEDQAETLLLQLFRGSGIKGLAVMPKRSPLGKGFLIRPLLEMQRHELLTYAQAENLQWIEDESNANINFDRNYIRHQIMPVIRQRWPAITPILGRVAHHCAQADALLDKLAESTLNSELLPVTSLKLRPNTLPVKKLLALSDAEQNNLLRYWLYSQNFPTPSAKQLQQLKENVLCSKPNASPLLHWAGINIRRYRDTLYVFPVQPAFILPNKPISWDMQQPITLPDGRILCAEDCKNIPLQTVEIRFRQHSQKSLKKIFQKAGIPPWERKSVPLIYINNILVCIVTA